MALSMLRVRPVQVLPAPVRAACLASGGQPTNRITAAPARQWKAAPRRNHSSQALVARLAVPSSIFGLRDLPRSNFSDFRNQHENASLSRLSLSGSMETAGDDVRHHHAPQARVAKPTNAAGHGPPEPGTWDSGHRSRESPPPLWNYSLNLRRISESHQRLNQRRLARVVGFPEARGLARRDQRHGVRARRTVPADIAG